MRKPSKPWYRSFNDTWYVCLNGRQIPLAKGKGNRKEAECTFYRLMAGETPAAIVTSDTRVVAILDLFLDHSQKHNSSRTYEWYRDFLQDFTEMFGMLRVQDLKPFHVTRWLDSHAGWDGSRRGAIIAVKRAFNWATDEGLIAANPVKNVKKPPQRARERFLTPEERGRIFDNYRESDCFRDFLFALEQTGGRPGEVSLVTAEHVDLRTGVWVLDEHKTEHITAESRIVILTPSMVELTKRLMELHPKGPLFRNEDDQPWNGNAIRCRFRRVRKSSSLATMLLRTCTATRSRPTCWSPAPASPRLQNPRTQSHRDDHATLPETEAAPGSPPRAGHEARQPKEA